MPINTGINPSLLVPQTFHVISYLLGGRTLTSVPQKLVLTGPQSAAGTATPGTIYQISDPVQSDALFGQGSYLALMCRVAFATMAYLGQGPVLYACSVADNTSGGTTKATETLTLGGPATADGQLQIAIAGRVITVGIANGTSATNAGIALAAAINAQAQVLPVTAGQAVGVVTCTDNTRGTIGADTIYDVLATPAGMTCVAAAGVAGAGVNDLQVAFTAQAGQPFDACAISNHQAADITEISTEIASLWSSQNKNPCWFFVGEPGSIATATTLAGDGNHEGVEIINWQQSRSLPGELATAAAVLALSKSRPNANYNKAKLPLYPPPAQYAYTKTQCESALAAGVTPLVPVNDPGGNGIVAGVGAVVRLITSRTTVNSQPYGITRDFGISRTAWALAKQLDIKYAQLVAQAGNDGMLLDEDSEDLVKDMVVDTMYAAQDAKWIQNVDTNKAQLQALSDAYTSGRMDVDMLYDIIPILCQIAFVHRAQVG